MGSRETSPNGLLLGGELPNLSSFKKKKLEILAMPM